jgi:dTDP-glucose 4,6-dehydratase
MKDSKTILVTGGAGFIASNFVRYILEKYTNYRVMVLDCLSYAGNPENFNGGVIDSARFSFWYGNVRNPEIVNTMVSQADVVVHMAAETHVARSIYDNAVFFETDVLGTQVVANAVLKNRNVERFIHVSTSEVYGTALTEPMAEEHPLNPASPYASAKAGADRLVYSYYVTYGIPAIIVRPFNNYGPYQHLEKVIPRFITSALLNEPLTIHGDGKSLRDWLYVEDHC